MDSERTLREARAKYFGDLAETGKAVCEGCDRRGQIYWRTINATMAAAIITLKRYGKPWPEFTHHPSLPGDTHEMSELVWWNLVEEEDKVREDGGRAGFYRLTDDGDEFVRGIHKVKRTARVAPGAKVLELVGDKIGIREALGNPFDYRRLMYGEPPEETDGRAS